jgi:uncharacterized protein
MFLEIGFIKNAGKQASRYQKISLLRSNGKKLLDFLSMLIRSLLRIIGSTEQILLRWKKGHGVGRKKQNENTLKMKKTICIYHNADFDGIFCREIAKRFLPKDTKFIGWNYGDFAPEVPADANLYMLDISVDGLMDHPNLTWIDHHKSAMEKYGALFGYQIDGVAACRLAWQWFNRAHFVGVKEGDHFPSKEDFVERRVAEPLAVRLAGEYDIWDKRDSRTDVFQFGLRSRELNEGDWHRLLSEQESLTLIPDLLRDGELLQRYQQENDASIVKHRSFLVEFEGLKFLALNTARCNSLTFASRDVPETGHDALMGFYWNGKWNVSLYHALHRKDLDLSLIAVKHGGGGHRGACGFNTESLPFLK